MKNVVNLIIITLFLTSCQSAKDAFTLQKKNNTDEFLVEKKNPLVLPPEYGKLPLPSGEKVMNNENQDEEIESIINNESSSSSTKVEKNTKPTLVEQSILDKIK
tara:strand:- start:642 stop:953 length:312 start_codon:yes stop_codon:yes gene_type:complete